MAEKSSRLMVAATTIASLTALSLGLALYSLEASADFAVVDLGLCPGGEHVCKRSVVLLRMASLVGFIASALATGMITISGKMSRRVLLMLSNGLVLAGSLVLTFTVNIGTLFGGRVLSGLGLGMNATALLFMIEVCHPNSRGYYTFLYQFFLGMGLMLSSAWQLLHGRVASDSGFQVKLIDKIVWRGAQLLPGLSALGALLLLMFAYKYRTPYQLVERGMMEEARHVAEMLYGRVGEGEDPEYSVDDMLKEFDRDAELAKDKPNMYFYDAFRVPLYLKTMVIVFVLACVHQLVGVTVFTESTPYVVTEAIGRSYKATVVCFLLPLTHFVVTFILFFFINKLGRKTLILIGSAFSAIFSFFALFSKAIGKDADWVPTVTLVGYFGFTIGYAFGLGGVAFVYLAEVYPTQCRNFAFGVAIFANWSCTRIATFGTEFLDMFSPMIAKSLFFFANVFTVFYVWLFIRETKDVPLGKAYESRGIFAFRPKNVL